MESNVDTEYIQGEINMLRPEKTIIILTRRRPKHSIRFNGSSSEKRKFNWFAYFKNRLGEPLQVSGLPFLLHQISNTLDINTNHIRLDEININIQVITT